MKRIISILILVFCVQQAFNQELSIIPLPKSMTLSKQSFILDNKTTIFYDRANVTTASYLQSYLEKYYGLKLIVAKQKGKETRHSIILSKKEETNKEKYFLQSTPDKIVITGEAPGVFYGVQSLIQLLPVPKELSSFSVPCVSIEDMPEFKWRGLMIDVSRHFLPVSYVKRFIDQMAHYKFNTFHWHLADNEGWRIQIDKYPKLTEVGSKVSSKIGPFNHIEKGGNEGYFSKEDIREIIKYAKDRFITVIPEIEVPGHSLAALYAYPEFAVIDTTGADGLKKTYKDLYCPTESFFSFFDDIITEVAELFPAEYIHIGGDEANMKAWLKDPRAMKVIKQNGLKDEKELQSYIIKRVEKIVLSKKKKMIGWDEILEGGLAESAAVMSWRGEEGGIAAARMHHNVVMSPTSHLYFDYSYQTTPLEKVYQYHPVPSVLKPDEAKYILGAQANLWGERMADSTKVDYMGYPRILALSEVVWTPQPMRNWNSFEQRTQYHYELMAKWGIAFRSSAR